MLTYCKIYDCRYAKIQDFADPRVVTKLRITWSYADIFISLSSLTSLSNHCVEIKGSSKQDGRQRSLMFLINYPFAMSSDYCIICIDSLFSRSMLLIGHLRGRKHDSYVCRHGSKSRDSRLLRFPVWRFQESVVWMARPLLRRTKYRRCQIWTA